MDNRNNNRLENGYFYKLGDHWHYTSLEPDRINEPTLGGCVGLLAKLLAIIITLGLGFMLVLYIGSLLLDVLIYLIS